MQFSVKCLPFSEYVAR